jgi:hypothetical protein
LLINLELRPVALHFFASRAARVDASIKQNHCGELVSHAGASTIATATATATAFAIAFATAIAFESATVHLRNKTSIAKTTSP